MRTNVRPLTRIMVTGIDKKVHPHLLRHTFATHKLELHDGHELSAYAFHKEGHVYQAAIVENKLLSAALHYAKQMQQERDAKKLQSKSLTKRDKRLLRDRQAEASALPI